MIGRAWSADKTVETKAAWEFAETWRGPMTPQGQRNRSSVSILPTSPRESISLISQFPSLSLSPTVPHIVYQLCIRMPTFSVSMDIYIM